MKKLFILFFITITFTANAATIYTIPQGFFSRTLSTIKECKLNIKCYFSSRLGAAITTIASSDLISSFPSSYNVTIDALNRTKLENASSTGTLTFGYLTATSTTASSTLQSLNVVGTLMIGSTGSTTILGEGATSTFPHAITAYGDLRLGTTAT